VRAAYDHDRDAFSDSAEERIQQAINADVLLLDDLGAESRTAWVDETLYRILNARYNDVRPTVIATNEPLHRLEPRIASRMQERRFSMVVGMVGPDERLRLPTKSEAHG
jgi:DNA replication protein DnaC